VPVRIFGAAMTVVLVVIVAVLVVAHLFINK
jgi:hypothetical protein